MIETDGPAPSFPRTPAKYLRCYVSAYRCSQKTMPSYNNKLRRVVLPYNQNKEQRTFSMHLLEWGIDERNLEDHEKFASLSRKIIRQAQNNPERLERLKHATQRLPNDAEKAVRIVLQCAIQERPEERCRCIKDIFCGGRKYNMAPYNVYPSRKPNENHVVYVRKKWEYDNLSKLDLDPLARFSEVPLTRREDYKEWFTSPEIAEGLVYEARVAIQALYNEACRNCLGRKCLLWNGGPNVSWADMVCSNCDSTYEIKSRINMEAIERSNEHILIGGDFMNYHSLCSEERKDGWKRYLVEVSRKPSSTRIGSSSNQPEWNWIVQIAPIDRLIPRLSPSCFVDGRKMRPKSHVVLKAPTSFGFVSPT